MEADLVAPRARNPTEEHLVTRLTGLGLDEVLSRVYLALLRFGVAKPSDVARHLKQDRAATYRRLQRLCEEGAASRVVERPARFEATSPKVFVALQKKRLRRQVDLLPRLEQELEQVHLLAPRTATDVAPRTLWLEGRPLVLEAIAELALQARKEILLVDLLPDTPTLRPMDGRPGPVLTLARPSVGMRVLVPEDARERAQGLMALHADHQVRATDAADLLFVVIDGREAVQLLRDGPAAQGLRTDAAGARGALAALFEALWAPPRPPEAPR